MSLEDFIQKAELSLSRHVRTPEGARKYGEPVGSPITKDMIAAVKVKQKLKAPAAPEISEKSKPADASKFPTKPDGKPDFKAFTAEQRTAYMAHHQAEQQKKLDDQAVKRPEAPKPAPAKDDAFSKKQAAISAEASKVQPFEVADEAPPTPEEAKAGVKEGKNIGSGMNRHVYHREGDFWAYKRGGAGDRSKKANDAEMKLYEELKASAGSYRKVKLPQFHRVDDQTIAVQYVPGRPLSKLSSRDLDDEMQAAVSAAHRLLEDWHDDNVIVGDDGNLWLIDLDGLGDF